MTHDLLCAHLHARTDHYLQQAATVFGLAVVPPTLRFDLRGRAAGRASRREQGGVVTYRIAYNLAMAWDHRDDLDHTVGHEVAHIVAWMQYGSGIKPHGREWRAVMGLFGLPATIHHPYAMQSHYSRLRYWAYRCGCSQEQALSSLRHNRVQTGEQQYVCRRCREVLRWTGRRV